MARVIRWLVLGSGRAARCHVAAINLAEGARLAGMVARRAVDLGEVPVFHDLSDALAGLQPDAVVIATPHDHHVAAATTALSAGIPVLCEKPVGRNALEAADILRLAAQRDTPVGVVLNQRACRHAAWIQRQIAAGEFACRAASISVTIPKLKGWNAEPARTGGGGLRTVGLHYLDLLCWWFGPPTWIAASLAGGPNDDVAQLLLRFAGDVQATLTVTAVGERFLSAPQILLQADRASIQLRAHAITQLHGLADPPELEPDREALLFGPGHLAVIQAATDGLLAGRGFPVPLADAMPLLQLLDEIYAGTEGAGVFCGNPSGQEARGRQRRS